MVLRQSRRVDVVFVGGPADGKSADIPETWLDAGVTFCAYGLTAEDEGAYIIDRPVGGEAKRDELGRYVYREYEGTALPSWLTSKRMRATRSGMTARTTRSTNELR